MTHQVYERKCTSTNYPRLRKSYHDDLKKVNKCPEGITIFLRDDNYWMTYFPLNSYRTEVIAVIPIDILEIGISWKEKPDIIVRMFIDFQNSLNGSDS